MWGTQIAIERVLPPIRFIPTHVGNTTPGSCHTYSLPVHPHACGEHGGDVKTPAALHGSSPRMWGTRNAPVSAYLIHRFIPTHVGNTHLTLPPIPHRPVHPHACGEHLPLSVALVYYRGSSPRMWGTLHPDDSHRVTNRFIPTHVGNTAQGGGG